MYIRKSSRTYNGKTYFNYVLVESVLTPHGPRQKVICSLGDLRPRPQADWLALAHKLTSALSGQADLLNAQAPDPELRLIVRARRSSAYRGIARGWPSPRRLPVLVASRLGWHSRASWPQPAHA